jgi:hypothetical protein
LPKAKQDALEWLAAIEALILVAGRGGDTMLPHIGIMWALYPGEKPVRAQRKKAAKKYRIIR